MSAFQKGDRIDWRGNYNGEVTRVGVGTLWVIFKTDRGLWNTTVPIDQARPHVGRHEIQIGGFIVRSYLPGRVFIQHLNGDGGVFDEAKIESILEAFFRKEF